MLLPGAGNVREAFKFDCRDGGKVPGNSVRKTKFSIKGSTPERK